METLFKAFVYSLLIVIATAGIIYLLHLVYGLFRYLEARYPRIWLLVGAGLVLLALLLDRFQWTVYALLSATAGLLLATIGGVLWWLEYRDDRSRSRGLGGDDGA